MAEQEEPAERRRSIRLALTEIQLQQIQQETPNKYVSADELVILQRGPRRRPITWSPVDTNKTPASPQKQQTANNTASAEMVQPKLGKKRTLVNPRTRRRLILSPTKNSQELGTTIARKLKALPKFNLETVQHN